MPKRALRPPRGGRRANKNPGNFRERNLQTRHRHNPILKRATFLFFLALALLKLNSVAGVTGFFDHAGRIKSLGSIGIYTSSLSPLAPWNILPAAFTQATSPIPQGKKEWGEGQGALPLN